MADFCAQCSLELFGVSSNDFEGIAPEGYLARVMCEGCGNTHVNHLGVCKQANCRKEHGTVANLGEYHGNRTN